MNNNHYLTDGLETKYLKKTIKYEYLGNCPNCKNKEVIIDNGLSYCSKCGLVYEITEVRQYLKEMEMKNQLIYNTHSILYNHNSNEFLSKKEKEKRRKQRLNKKR